MPASNARTTHVTLPMQVQAASKRMGWEAWPEQQLKLGLPLMNESTNTAHEHVIPMKRFMYTQARVYPFGPALNKIQCDWGAWLDRGESVAHGLWFYRPHGMFVYPMYVQCTLFCSTLANSRVPSLSEVA